MPDAFIGQKLRTFWQTLKAHFAPQAADDVDKELSLGEQERLAFARLLLNKPSWVFLDEATAALDEDSQRHVMSLFDDELKNTTVLSIGHRPDLAAYHTRTLQLVHGRDGERLKLKPPPTPPPPPHGCNDSKLGCAP